MPEHDMGQIILNRQDLEDLEEKYLEA